MLTEFSSHQLSAFAWNVHDGRLPEKDLSEFQRERALKQLPSILDYLGYVVRMAPYAKRLILKAYSFHPVLLSFTPGGSGV